MPSQAHGGAPRAAMAALTEASPAEAGEPSTAGEPSAAGKAAEIAEIEGLELGGNGGTEDMDEDETETIV